MTDTLLTERLALARNIAASFAVFPEVEAIALGGSLASGYADADSDIDLYVYVQQEIDVAIRARVITPRAGRAEIDNRVAEPSDVWVEDVSGVAVELMYRQPDWIEAQLDRVLLRHEASFGYSTSFWHNVRTSLPLFDRSGWFSGLQTRASQPYPEELAWAIIAKNQPFLRAAIFSCLEQLAAAVQRDDPVVASQKLVKLLASYFDVIFALNRLTHPGEKRMLLLAARAEKTPPGMVAAVRALIQAVFAPGGAIAIPARALLDGLDQLLAAEGLLDAA